MSRLLRQPIAWMVAAELLVVTALVAVAWHELSGTSATPPAPLVLSASPPPDGIGAPDLPAGVLGPPAPRSPELLPGLNVDPSFWRARLAGLNDAEAQFEALEWRIIHSAMDTVRRYVDTVVVPAVERAEKTGARRSLAFLACHRDVAVQGRAVLDRQAPDAHVAIEMA